LSFILVYGFCKDNITISKEKNCLEKTHSERVIIESSHKLI
jgi:hypothetical protein